LQIICGHPRPDQCPARATGRNGAGMTMITTTSTRRIAGEGRGMAGQWQYRTTPRVKRKFGVRAHAAA
jgi:hypothetical protein